MIHLPGLFQPYLFLGAFILVLAGSRLTRSTAAIIGCSTIALAALITLLIRYEFLATHANAYHHVAWNWFAVGGLSVGFSFHLDALSLVFLFVITFVGFSSTCIPVGFMHNDEGFTRASLHTSTCLYAPCSYWCWPITWRCYLGWEGVGLCSYLLIGFWYDEEKNGYAARKALL